MRHLDSSIHAIQVKTKVCQLVEAMMIRRDDLTFRQEMKFRNKLVEYLTDWIMGNSHQLNVQGDVFHVSRYEPLLRFKDGCEGSNSGTHTDGVTLKTPVPEGGGDNKGMWPPEGCRVTGKVSSLEGALLQTSP